MQSNFQQFEHHFGPKTARMQIIDACKSWSGHIAADHKRSGFTGSMTSLKELAFAGLQDSISAYFQPPFCKVRDKRMFSKYDWEFRFCAKAGMGGGEGGGGLISAALVVSEI